MLPQGFLTSKNIQNGISCNQYMMNPQQIGMLNLNLSGLPIPMQFQQYANSIASAIANYISVNSNKTPGRLYQWNEICQNGFNNQEMMALVILVANYTAIGMQGTIHTDFNSSLNASIQFMVDSRGAWTICHIPEILAMYDPQAQNNIRQLANQYLQEANKVQSFIMQSMQQGFNQGMMPQGFNSFGHQPMMFQQQMVQQPMMQGMQPMQTHGAFINNNQGYNQNAFQQPNTPVRGNSPFIRSSNFAEQMVNNFIPQVKEEAVKNHVIDVASIEKLAASQSTGGAVMQPVSVQQMVNNQPKVNTEPVATPSEPQTTSEFVVPSVKLGNPAFEGLPKVAENTTKEEDTNSIDTVKGFTPIMAVDQENAITDDLWKPSELQWYPPAYDPVRFKRVLKFDKDAQQWLYFVEEKPLGENMDRNAHRITSSQEAINSFQPMKIGRTTITSRDDQIKVSLDKIAETHKENFRNTKEEFAEIKDELLMAGYVNLEVEENSLDDAIISTQIARAVETDTAKSTGAFHSNFTLVESFIIEGNEKDKFEEIFKSKKLIDFALKIRTILKSEDSSLNLIRSVIQLDNYIKSNLVSVLRNQLNLKNLLDIECFADDYENMVSDIQRQGQVFYDAFKNYEKTFIKKYLQIYNTEELSDGENPLVRVMIGTQCSVTMVDYTLKELKLTKDYSSALAVTNLATELIYRFINTIVENSSDEGMDIFYGRHWFVTIDGYRVEMFKSLLDNETVIAMV